MIIAACILMTAALFIYIFSLPPRVDPGARTSRLVFLRERKESVYENLRDLNFDYNAGKLPDADYQSMRASLEDEAAALLAEIEVLEGESAGPVSRGSSAGQAKGARI